MRELVILFVHALATLARLLGPGGIWSVVAESVLVKQQLLILNRARQRSPNLRTSLRFLYRVTLHQGLDLARHHPGTQETAEITRRSQPGGSPTVSRLRAQPQAPRHPDDLLR